MYVRGDGVLFVVPGPDRPFPPCDPTVEGEDLLARCEAVAVATAASRARGRRVWRSRVCSNTPMLFYIQVESFPSSRPYRRIDGPRGSISLHTSTEGS